jgi:hypothetical protein
MMLAVEARAIAGRPGARAVILLALAYVVLTGVWIPSSRPFAAPDETAHYLRALTIANGHLTGARAPNTLLGVQGRISALGRRFEARNSRAVRVPASLAPAGTRCLDGTPDASGTCTMSTYTGNYQPLPYLLPALAIGVSSSVHSASWLARLGSALPAAALLALAVWLLWDGTVWSMLGPAIALTPMVLFLASVLNPGGVEVAACAAFFAALLRLTRATPPGGGLGVWIAAGVSGVIAILSWQLGFVFVGLDLLAAAAIVLARMSAAPLAVGLRRPVLGLLGALGGAVVLYVLYTVSAGSPSTTIALEHIGDLHSAVNQLRSVFEEAVGTFGQLTVPLPGAVRYLWSLLALALVLTAGLRGTARERIVLLGVAVTALLFMVLFDALVYRHTGFGLQARYVLPVLMMVPLLAGEILHERPPVQATVARILAAGAITILAVLQLAAWWVNAAASAGRPRTSFFPTHAAWSPPLGWGPWLAGAVIGCLLLVAGGWSAGLADIASSRYHLGRARRN